MTKFKNDGFYTTTSDGVNIYYEVDGRDHTIPLLIVPGLGGSEETYNHVATMLQHNYKVIKLDGRGLGLSDAPDGNYTMDMLVEDVFAVIRDLNLTQVHLLGHSLGGFVVQQFYNTYPEYVQSLILMSTNVGFGDVHSLLPTPEQLADFNQVLRPDDPDLKQKVMRKTLMCYDKDFVFSARGEKIIEEITFITLARVKYDNICKRGRAGWNFSNFDRLPTINVPVLVIQGQNDQLVPCANADVFERFIPDCRKVLIEGCGHSPFLEQPELFVSLVDRFLRT